MTDPYLLLTPLLALVVLALARFVGCDKVFDLEPVPDPPAELPFVESYMLGQSRNNSMNPFTGWVGMEIRVGAKPLMVTQLGRILLTETTVAHDVKLVERAGQSGGTDVQMGAVTIQPSAVIPPSGFAYATLPKDIELKADTEYYVVSHEDGTAVDVFYDVDATTVTPTEAAMNDGVAVVTFGVYNPDAEPGVYYRMEMPGIGNTYGPVDFKYRNPA